jgi:hypothetical protein
MVLWLSVASTKPESHSTAAAGSLRKGEGELWRSVLAKQETGLHCWEGH